MTVSEVEANFLFLLNFYATFAAEGVPPMTHFQANCYYNLSLRYVQFDENKYINEVVNINYTVIISHSQQRLIECTLNLFILNKYLLVDGLMGWFVNIHV